jgi:hypothetical protein
MDGTFEVYVCVQVKVVGLDSIFSGVRGLIPFFSGVHAYAHRNPFKLQGIQSAEKIQDLKMVKT